MKCPYCGSEIEDGVKFCTSCGGKIENEPQVKYCPQCGDPVTNPDQVYCEKCGCKLDGTGTNNKNNVNKDEEQWQSSSQRKVQDNTFTSSSSTDTTSSFQVNLKQKKATNNFITQFITTIFICIFLVGFFSVTADFPDDFYNTMPLAMFLIFPGVIVITHISSFIYILKNSSKTFQKITSGLLMGVNIGIFIFTIIKLFVR